MTDVPVRVVCLDIGEVVVDETRVWSTWAEVLGCSPLELIAELGAALAAGDSHLDLLRRLGGPGWRELVPAHEDRLGPLREDDLHADVRDGIAVLRDLGPRVVLAGNQPARRSPELEGLDLGVDDIVTSDELGAAKPDGAFFSRLLQRLGDPPASSVVYVGDRHDNDVRPAAAAGLRPIWLRRGPWARLAPYPAQDESTARDLSEVAAVVRGWISAGPDDQGGAG